MSREMAVAFIEKARNEVGIQERVIGINTATDFDKFIDLASSLGYPFTEQDFTDAARSEAEYQSFQIEEISEGDLEDVAGGVVNKGNAMTPRASITSSGTSVIFPKGSISINPSGGIPQR